MLATVLLPVLFLCIKGYEYYEKVQHDHLPSHSTFLAIYWTMTALHGLHIIGGIAVNGYFWGPGSKMWHTKPAMFENRIEAAGRLREGQARMESGARQRDFAGRSHEEITPLTLPTATNS